MVSHSHRLQSGQITCYFDRTYHVLTTLAGAMIVLVPVDATHNRGMFRVDQSDSDGTFSLTKIVPGKYTLLALEHGWDLPQSEPKVLKPYLAGGIGIEVQNHQTLKVKVKVQTARVANNRDSRQSELPL